jgi:hypothetical protein
MTDQKNVISDLKQFEIERLKATVEVALKYWALRQSADAKLSEAKHQVKGAIIKSAVDSVLITQNPLLNATTVLQAITHYTAAEVLMPDTLPQALVMAPFLKTILSTGKAATAVTTSLVSETVEQGDTAQKIKLLTNSFEQSTADVKTVTTHKSVTLSKKLSDRMTPDGQFRFAMNTPLRGHGIILNGDDTGLLVEIEFDETSQTLSKIKLTILNASKAMQREDVIEKIPPILDEVDKFHQLQHPFAEVQKQYTVSFETWDRFSINEIELNTRLARVMNEKNWFPNKSVPETKALTSIESTVESKKLAAAYPAPRKNELEYIPQKFPNFQTYLESDHALAKKIALLHEVRKTANGIRTSTGMLTETGQYDWVKLYKLGIKISGEVYNPDTNWFAGEIGEHIKKAFPGYSDATYADLRDYAIFHQSPKKILTPEMSANVIQKIDQEMPTGDSVENHRLISRIQDYLSHKQAAHYGTNTHSIGFKPRTDFIPEKISDDQGTTHQNKNDDLSR